MGTRHNNCKSIEAIQTLAAAICYELIVFCFCQNAIFPNLSNIILSNCSFFVSLQCFPSVSSWPIAPAAPRHHVFARCDKRTNIVEPNKILSSRMQPFRKCICDSSEPCGFLNHRSQWSVEKDLTLTAIISKTVKDTAKVYMECQ